MTHKLPSAEPQRLRIATYNVHKCRGMDVTARSATPKFSANSKPT